MNLGIISEKIILSERGKTRLKWILICLLALGYAAAAFAQNNLNELNYQAQSEFQPTVKDAFKFSDMPEIKDSVKRISDIHYSITDIPMTPKYSVQTIRAANLQNEPLPKLYRSLLKLGYAPLYAMPYGEFWLGSTRSRDENYGLHLKHLSSSATLKDAGYSGFSDNEANIYGKKYLKKHTLSGDFNYARNVVHYYGYNALSDTLTKDQTKQRYQIFEPKIRLQSHYTDSSHINHDLNLSFYNLQNLNRENENNIKFDGKGTMFLNKEKLNLNFLTDYYNTKQANDTVNDLIVSLNPSFEAQGKKWYANIGLTATMDNFNKDMRFYFYPQLHLQYDVYESMLIPYAGANGGLIKNSFRSLSTENPFVDTTLGYANTNNAYNIYGGLRGNISSRMSYDAKASYGQYNNMHFFVTDYFGANSVYNRFKVFYYNTSLLKVSGELKYQLREKFNLIAKGNYYMYKTEAHEDTALKFLNRAFQKPDFDLTLSGIYNLHSKFIVRADFFVMGKQWALTQVQQDTVTVLKPTQLKSWIDLNLEGEYRYSKMLSFFVRFNNIAAQRYYRWNMYPNQRFNFMIGLTFVPF
ncbi:MAG: TonB-dependent receptor [Bacteroidetes bacterium]|nr:TonB-dependent receptor [Bacteroidota bacterium]